MNKELVKEANLSFDEWWKKRGYDKLSFDDDPTIYSMVKAECGVAYVAAYIKGKES